jgi:hypothetical protein
MSAKALKMENIDIKGFKDDFFIPTVNFNAETEICEISGESYLEETVEFYNPLIKWLEEYTNSGNYKKLTFNFKLTYYNTSSSKRIVDILLILRSFEEKGNELNVNWYYEEDDLDIVEEVEDFMKISRLHINLLLF